MIYVLIVVAIVYVESKIKSYIEKNKNYGVEEEILNGKIIINKYHNSGMFLNFLDNKKELVKFLSFATLGALSMVFALVIPKKRSKLLKFGFSLMLGGAISNVMDRFKRGYVVDYFSFRKIKNIVFNLADICIFIGSILIAIASLFFDKMDGGLENLIK